MALLFLPVRNVVMGVSALRQGYARQRDVIGSREYTRVVPVNRGLLL